MSNTPAMKEAVSKYFSALSEKYATGQAREHAYRPTFEALIKAIDQSLNILNDPARSEHGNPDFIFLRGEVMIGYAETKDIGIDLDKTEKSEQLKRYFGYSNLLLTDYLEFRFFRNGNHAGESIKVGSIKNGKLEAHPEQFEELARALSEFVQSAPEKIKSGKRLAEIMGGKARRVRDNLRKYLADDSEKNEELRKIYQAVDRLLVHNISLEKFSDMYAQTLVYGLFVARYNDESPEGFTRIEARDLVPASNPFLREFFDHIVGPRFDKRLGYIVDELCSVFAVSDVREIVHKHLKVTGDGQDEKDPIIHFYEDFLQEYDPEERKKMGAYYTPIPVVRFIVRAVDEILKRDFGLPKGLADTTKKQVEIFSQGKKAKVDIHRVQVLDPAVGTATFLNETIKHIHKSFEGQEGRWVSYVQDDLLPRLYGFELMMAPYTIAHLKLGITLRETGVKELNKRLGVYLTNTLEEGVLLNDSLFGALGLAQTIAHEAAEAGRIKKEKPIMVVIGNPPYSVSSANNGGWIQNEIGVYKEGLNERNIQPLSDDYIKFIRFAEGLVEKNESGIVAMITNNSFIDGVIHRQMRKRLLETFDAISILDLHGNSKKKEMALDGSKDQNVFNIQQGVSIMLAVKTGKKKKGDLAEVRHAELFGKRESKFDALDKDHIKFTTIMAVAPGYVFVPKDIVLQEEYNSFISLRELMPFGDAGIKTHRDDFVIDIDRKALISRISDFIDGALVPAELGLEDTRDFNIQEARQKLAGKEVDSFIERIDYRPFDERLVFYSDAVVDWPRRKTMSQIIKRDNIALIFTRQAISGGNYSHVMVSRKMADNRVFYSNKGIPIEAPLYLYTDDGKKTVNLKKEIVDKISGIVGEVTPEKIFDYVYAVLYSPNYRKKYGELLKTDFPRIPYPKNRHEFDSLVMLGCELRKLHLMESPKLNNFITTYPKDGSNEVEKVTYKDGNVWINTEQYFGKVPEVAWNFFIGGYQPAQKWLKDRKGRVLSSADIEHYQKMIVALVETDRVMGEIDVISI